MTGYMFCRLSFTCPRPTRWPSCVQDHAARRRGAGDRATRQVRRVELHHPGHEHRGLGPTCHQKTFVTPATVPLRIFVSLGLVQLITTGAHRSP